MLLSPPTRLALTLGLSLGLALSASGQVVDTPVAPPPGTDPPAPVESAPTDVELISITGDQIDVTDVQDEAQAITRFSMEDLDKLNISNVDGLAANVPGLHVGQQGQAAIITMRGVGTENASITGESGVAFHVDGVYFARPTAARVAFFDVQLIDVHRGPQGLLGGKNSTSGTINVITNDPGEEYEVSGDILFGNYDRVRARGHINVPLGEYASARAAFFHEDRDGYLDNKLVSDSRDPFDADNFGMRTKLRLAPSEGLDMVLSYNYFKQTGNGPQADNVPIFTPNICGTRRGIPPGFSSSLPGPFVCRTSAGRHVPAIEDGDERTIFADNPSSQDDRFWGLHGKVRWDVPELPALGLSQLELRGGYQRTQSSFDWDFDATNLPRFDLETEGLSHEYVGDLRWQGRVLDERLDWQTSLFFAREKGSSRNRNPVIVAGDLGPGGGGVPTELVLETKQDVVNLSYGFGLHGTYHLADTLALSLGGRWIKDRKRSRLFRVEGTSLAACEGADLRPINVGGTIRFPEVPTCDKTDRGIMWGSRLEWRPTSDHLVYAGIDRGHKAGGFGLGGTGEYVPEKIWAYTLGTKSEFFDRKLQLNLEGFFYAYEDMQFALIDGTSTRTENGDTRMYGWELEANAAPLPGLELRAVLGYLKTEVIEYYSLDPARLNDVIEENRRSQRRNAERLGQPFAARQCQDPVTLMQVRCGQLGDRDGLDSFEGNALSRSPEWKLTLSAEYELPLGDLGSLTPRVQYTWQDETYFRAFNRSFDLQEDYHTTDVKLVWRSPEGRYTAEAFVTNVEDVAVKDYILIGSSLFQAPPLAWYNSPRFYGVSFGFRY